MIFTSHRPLSQSFRKYLFNGQPFSNLWILRFKKANYYSLTPLGKPFYTPANEGNIAIHPSGNFAFYSICNQGKTQKGDGCEIYKVWYDRIRSKWYRKEKIPELAHSSSMGGLALERRKVAENYDSHPAFTKNGKIVFFSSRRPGGYGGSDIWFSKLQPNGFWSPPQNAGPLINSPFDEIYPQPAPDNSYLIFSSNLPGSLGGYDLYRAYTADTFQSFYKKDSFPPPLILQRMIGHSLGLFKTRLGI
ncbi:MAG: hypothetical protein RML72_09190 [Bacteroidia bacterium]|nr:hypothetical protein [Bacteroidia bacterium]